VRQALREGGTWCSPTRTCCTRGILPNHTKWQGLFTGLRYVVVDELHTLSGIYGSHVANVLRRLCASVAHYGSKPVFCGASATISNAGEHAQRLFERPVRVVDDDGSPRGRKHYVFFNPKVVSTASGMRVPASEAARQLGGSLAAERTAVDLLRALAQPDRGAAEVPARRVRSAHIDQERVAGYRGGYLPNLRRSIEKGLREGHDPHRRVDQRARTRRRHRQPRRLRAGRLPGHGVEHVPARRPRRAALAGERRRPGRAQLRRWTSSSCSNPGYLFDAPREAVSIDPDNAIILTNHVRCAAFELPFDARRGFGKAEGIDDVLEFLTHDL
jgi:DEAD/DEAH box helicase domain-containing protein